MARQKQRQTQKQVVIVNVGTGKRKAGGKRKARSAPTVMVQQVIPPIPLSVQSQPQTQADFAMQFMKALAGMGEGMTVKKDTVAPQIVLNNPNNAKIAQEQENIQLAKGFPSFKAEEDDFNVKNLRDIQQQMWKAQEKAQEGKEEASPYSYSMYGTPDLPTPIKTPPGEDLWSTWRGQPLQNEPAMPSQAMSSAEAIRLNGPPIGLPPIPVASPIPPQEPKRPRGRPPKKD